MSRTVREKRETVQRLTYDTVYRCDKCGKEISREDHEGDYAHELLITLDQFECVSYLRERDYCPGCLEPIWLAINALIGGDPDTEHEDHRD